MPKYHLNPTTGNPGECSAEQGKCPFGKDAPHYGSQQEAREAFEAQQEAFGAIKKDLSSSAGAPKSPQEEHPYYGTKTKAIATMATRHNEGQTVLEQRLDDGDTVSLKMSSWPRANEARRALEKEGYFVELGENNMGQWIHVSPMPKDSEILDMGDLSGEVDDLFAKDHNMGEPFPRVLYSPKIQESCALKEPVEDWADGELKGWILKPRFQEVPWAVYLRRV